MDYLGYLIHTKQIDKNDAKSLLSSEIKSLYTLLNSKEQKKYDYFTKIYHAWQTED
jgi:hypothetical protein